MRNEESSKIEVQTMKKLLWIVLAWCGLAGAALAQAPFIFQVQNNGTTVGSQAGLGRINLISGCTANQSGGAFNLTCTGGAGNPGGSANQLEYNVAGTSFGGVSSWSTNGTTTITANAAGILDMSAAALAGVIFPTASTTGFLRVTTATGALSSAEVSGDCTSAAFVLTCLKTNNVAFTALATTTPAAGVATFLATPSSANLLSALTTKTGTGLAAFATSPAFLGTPDASGAAQFKLPVGAGFATLANGEVGYDTTNGNWHFWQNGADAIAAIFSGALTNGNCPKISVAAGVTTLVDSGSTCGGGGGAFVSGAAGTGYQDVTEIAAPANPAAGVERLYSNSTTHVFSCLTSAGGNCLPSSGTVTSFSAGTFSPLFTTSVASATTTPALSFVASNAAAGTVFGNPTGAAAASIFTSTPVLGLAGTTVGTLGYANATSGSITVTPPTGALGSVTNTLQATTDTFVYKSTTDILSNKTLVAPALGTPASGVLTTTTGYIWNNLAAPTGNFAPAMGSNTSIFTTTTALSQLFAWKNTTAAVVGTSQGSPVLANCGTAFHGSASVESCATWSMLPGNGNDAAITINHGISGTSTGLVTDQFTGAVAAGANGTNVGILQLPGNSTNPTPAANAFSLLGPASASFTGYGWQPPTAENGSAGILHIGAAASHISQATISLVALASDVSGQLPIGNVGSVGLSATGPVRIASTGVIDILGAGTVAPAQGGTGVGNTATLTLGSSNQNWATLGTGIVKNTTTTGALSNATSGDILGLCTTCVVASSPGVGIAHFAGSTQTVTSSAVVNADITSMSEDKLTGSAAQVTITETAIAHEITRAGVETTALTYPYVFQNTNATNTSTGALAVYSVGAGNAQVPFLVAQNVSAGDIAQFGQGTFTNGVLSAFTKQAGIGNTGNLSLGSVPTITSPGSGSELFGTDGTEPTSIAAGTSGWTMDSTSNCPVQWNNAANVGCSVAASSVTTLTNKTLLGSVITGATITGSPVIQTPLNALGIFNPAALPVTTTLPTLATLGTLSTDAQGKIIGQPIGVTTAAMATQATNAALNITGMVWTIQNLKNYRLTCEIPITLTTTATLAFSLANSGGGAPTSVSIDAQGSLGAANTWADVSALGQTTWAAAKTSTSGAAATSTVAKVWAQIQGSANSGGTLTLQTWDIAGTGTIQVLANATCNLQQEN
jgi:hypothetical protein